MKKILASNFCEIMRNINFVNHFKSMYIPKKDILFIPSEPNKIEKTKKYIETYVDLLREKGFEIGNAACLNENIKIENVLYNKYSIIFIMGGSTLKQNYFIKEKKIAGLFNQYDGVVLGLSGGALNMCLSTLLTTVHGEENGEAMIIRGLGLTNITVEVHFDQTNRQQLIDIGKVKLTVFCIPESSALVLENEQFNAYGSIYIINEHEFYKLK